MTAATFSCPHCQASYPLKPVLIGRAVRCTTCRKPFRLRGDGVADKVIEVTDASAITKSGTIRVGSGLHAAPPEEPRASSRLIPANASAMPETPAESPDDARADWLTKDKDAEHKPQSRIVRRSGAHRVVAPTPRAELKANPPAPPAPAAPNAKPEPSPAPASSAAAGESDAPAKPAAGPSVRTNRVKRTLNSEQTAAQRDAMATTLSKAMDEAVKAESTKSDARPAAAKRGKGATKDIGPAVTTGEGEREAQRTRQWMLIGAGVIAAVILIAVLMVDRSPRRRALLAFTAEPSAAEDRAAGGRAQAISARSMLRSGPRVDAFVDLSDATFGRVETAPIREILTPLAGRVRLASTGLWIKPEAASAAAKAITVVLNNHQRHLSEAAKKNIDVVDGYVVVKKLYKDNLDFVAQLLLNPASASAANLAEAIVQDRIPETMEVLTFTGRNGTQVYRTGNGGDGARTGVPYRGRLMRMPELDPEWRMYDLLADTVTGTTPGEFEIPNVPVNEDPPPSSETTSPQTPSTLTPTATGATSVTPASTPSSATSSAVTTPTPPASVSATAAERPASATGSASVEPAAAATAAATAAASK